jgi:hypothetical protein
MRSFARFDGASLLLALTLSLVAAPAAAQPPAVPAPASALDVVLPRARAAIDRYLNEAAFLLADEQCEQKAFEAVRDHSGAGGVLLQPRGQRRWQAEIALVPTPELAAGGNPWTEFRDVLTVDGRPVPDREERLSTILQRQNTLRIDQARAITQQSARFNIGRERNTNTPSVPLLVLARSNAHRFAFSAAGEERIDGTGVLKVQFKELRSPTLIKSGGSDCFAVGSFWIATETGNVVQADVWCGNAGHATPPMTVRYTREAHLGLWMPSEMHERPFDGTIAIGMTSVEGKCRYSNYRRFETGAKLILK